MSSPLNYLIVHGSRGSPEGNWFPWLKRELEKTGAKVFAPHFPTPENQSLSTWQAVTDKTLAGISPRHTVLIGHSTGAVFVLRMAEKTETPFHAIFSVCPFMRDLGLKDYDPLNASFVHPPMDWVKAKQGADKIMCYAGDHDPYVPLAATQEVVDKLAAPLMIIKSGGHLNAESGYHQFPLLLDNILER